MLENQIIKSKYSEEVRTISWRRSTKKDSRSYFQSRCFEQRVLWVSISTSFCLRLRFFLLLGRGTAGCRCCWAEVPVAVGTFVVVVVIVVLGGRAVVGTTEAPVAVGTGVVVVVVIVPVAVGTGDISGSRIVLMMYVLVVACVWIAGQNLALNMRKRRR